MENSIWKDVKSYEGHYKVSSLGHIKSLKFNQERLLKLGTDANGYYIVSLCLNSKPKTRSVHQLVAESFLNHTPNGHTMVVNHINLNKKDNRVENLQIVTARENSNKKHLKSTSKYTGVCWDKSKKKWKSSTSINGEHKKLGYYDTEIEASNAYQAEIDKL